MAAMRAAATTTRSAIAAMQASRTHKASLCLAGSRDEKAPTPWRPTPAPTPKAAALAATALDAAKPATFAAGDAVELFGLESDWGKALNGQRGVITGWLEEKGRFEVQLSNGNFINLKPGNLTKVEQQASALFMKVEQKVEQVQGWLNHVFLTDGKKPATLVAGEVLEIFGLESDQGKALNGQRGMITGWLEEKGRFEVQLNNGNPVNVRPGNLKKDAESEPDEELVPLGVGDVVEICRLESGLGKALNARRGVITGWLEEEGRFQIQLNDGYSVNMKLGNLRRVGESSAAAASKEAS